MGRTKKLTRLPDKCCDRCRSWSSNRRPWEGAGEARGTCMWLANLAVGETRGVPGWVAESAFVRVTCDDDGTDCPAFETRLPSGDPK